MSVKIQETLGSVMMQETLGLGYFGSVQVHTFRIAVVFVDIYPRSSCQDY